MSKDESQVRPGHASRLTPGEFIMLRSLVKSGSWRECDAPLWKVARRWYHSRGHWMSASEACWLLEDKGLVSRSPLSCCQQHEHANVYILTDQGVRMVASINRQSRQMRTSDLLSLAQACSLVAGSDPVVIAEWVLGEARQAGGMDSERLVRLVKSARKMAAARSAHALAKLDDELVKLCTVGTALADLIRSVLREQLCSGNPDVLPSMVPLSSYPRLGSPIAPIAS